MTDTKGPSLAILAIGACILFSLLLGWNSLRPSFGSVGVSSEYQATSTAPSSAYGAQTNIDQLIRPVGGTLGSVIITGANTGVFNFFDATTTNVNLRTGQKATSTILIASIPASAVAGTYTFDVQFSTGLIYDVPAGIIPTSTITYR